MSFKNKENNFRVKETSNEMHPITGKSELCWKNADGLWYFRDGTAMDSNKKVIKRPKK